MKKSEITRLGWCVIDIESRFYLFWACVACSVLVNCGVWVCVMFTSKLGQCENA